MTRPLTVIAWPAFKTAAANPYQSLLYQAVAQNDVHVVECTLRALFTAPRGSVLHLHWPDAFIANASLPIALLKLIALRILALWSVLRGVAWVWTAHNLHRPGQRHSTLMAWFFWPWFVKTLSGVLYLTHASQAAVEAAYPHLKGVPNAVTPHGTYSVSETRMTQTNRTELLFFGGVSRYKRVGDLVRAFGKLDRPDVHLRIAGARSGADPDPDVGTALDQLAPPLRANVTVEDTYLSAEGLTYRVRAARIIVLPLVAVQNSGTALYALSCHRPILVPRLPAFEELSTQVGPGWVHMFDGTLTASDIEDTLDLLDKVPAGSPDLTCLAWPEIGALTASFFKEIAA